MAKGKTGNILITLAVIVLGVKALTYIAGGQLKSADPTGAFSDLISGFLGIADLLFWGALALVVILMPYHFSKRKRKEKVSGRQDMARTAN